jgi:hypothetical protein
MKRHTVPFCVEQGGQSGMADTHSSGGRSGSKINPDTAQTVSSANVPLSQDANVVCAPQPDSSGAARLICESGGVVQPTSANVATLIRPRMRHQ